MKSYTVFHSDHAEVLGLKLEEGRKIFFTVGDGAQIPAYIHNEEFIAEVAFSESLGVGTNLLGLASFFEKFIFCFRHSKKEVEINPVKISGEK